MQSGPLNNSSKRSLSIACRNILTNPERIYVICRAETASLSEKANAYPFWLDFHETEPGTTRANSET